VKEENKNLNQIKTKNGFPEQPKNNLKYGFLFDKPPLTIFSASALQPIPESG